ncbi:hypothetical protein [Pseudoalteromonas sp. SW0106-04]|uniref:hypothetical protein n=1 Tax=Pseudoalteromonas sp. SW0106-04 TaxID=1702169 RepID=UPI0012FAB2D5|nr:hypothetical protein [Pseudoalteromonas sp. SW0106-04]
MRLTHVDGQGAWPFTMTIEKLDSGVWQFTVVQQVEHARHQAGSGLSKKVSFDSFAQ